jgi:hypothetical protein
MNRPPALALGRTTLLCSMKGSHWWGPIAIRHSITPSSRLLSRSLDPRVLRSIVPLSQSALTDTEAVASTAPAGVSSALRGCSQEVLGP